MSQRIQNMIEGFAEQLRSLGACQLFFLRLMAASPMGFLRPGLIVEKIYDVGARSLGLIASSGLFVGMVLGLQGYHNLSDFGAEDSLATMVALSLVKELGPVLTAILFAGRAGTSIASEIGLMRATEQLSAMEVMAVDPLRRIAVPPFVAGVISVPLLAGVFSAVGILGGYLIGVQMMGLDSGVYWGQLTQRVDLYQDVLGGVLKSFVFGVAASLLAVFEGYHCRSTAEGIAQATTRTVVLTALSVVVLDFLLTGLFIDPFTT